MLSSPFVEFIFSLKILFFHKLGLSYFIIFSFLKRPSLDLSHFFSKSCGSHFFLSFRLRLNDGKKRKRKGKSTRIFLLSLISYFIVVLYFCGVYFSFLKFYLFINWGYLISIFFLKDPPRIFLVFFSKSCGNHFFFF